MEKMKRRQKTLQRICHDFHLAAVYVFGSMATDAEAFLAGRLDHPTRKETDLDVGVVPVPGRRLTVKEKVNIAARLEDFFMVGRIDLVVLPEADPFLAANIIRGERIFAQDTLEADEYDLYILRRAGDLAPLERERQNLILEGGQ